MAEQVVENECNKNESSGVRIVAKAKHKCVVPILHYVGFKVPSTFPTELSPTYIEIKKGEVFAVIGPAGEQNIA